MAKQLTDDQLRQMTAMFVEDVRKQDDIAKVVGVAHSTVNRYQRVFNGKRAMPPHVRQQLDKYDLLKLYPERQPDVVVKPGMSDREIKDQYARALEPPGNEEVDDPSDILDEISGLLGEALTKLNRLRPTVELMDKMAAMLKGDK
tara:strand:- start:28 stop:462 length:435 start_codon:yes stop_codon:yes gene_type:complete